MPLQKGDLIEFAFWSLGNRLYVTPSTFTDGRIKRIEETDGKVKIETGRKKENVKTSRVVWLDADSAAPEVFKLEPSIIIKSSESHWHLYWELEDAYPTERVATLVQKIAYAHANDGADKSSPAGGSKLMLVPGSKNTKTDRVTGELIYPDKPEVTVEFTGKKYTLAQIEAIYGDTDIPVRVNVTDEDRPSPLDFEKVYTALPEKSRSGKLFHDLVFNEPWKDSTGSFSKRSEMRHLLHCELFREHLTPQEVMTVSMASKASLKWAEDSRGYGHDFWNEILRAKAVVDAEMGIGNTPAPQASKVQSIAGLLTEDEIAMVDEHYPFVNEYQDWASTRLSKANLPYHRANSWSLLSACLGDAGVMVEQRGKMPLNIWVMEVGETGSGKGEARDLYENAAERLIPGGWKGGANLGANAHANALTKALIKRDKKVSVLFSDEAHGIFQIMQQQTWTTGTQELWTNLFDGDVPVMQRMTDDELSGKSASSVFLVWMQGTIGGLSKVLVRDMFDSGFLGRFCWAIGEPPLDTDESLRIKRPTGEYIGYENDRFLRSWDRRVKEARVLMGRDFMAYETDEALERLSDAIIDLKHDIEDSRNSESLRQAHRRIGMHMRKAAILNAMVEGRRTVEMIDALTAIRAAEEWWNNVKFMTEAISSSAFSQSQDKVLEFLEANGGSVYKEVLANHLKDIEPRDRAAILISLTEQGLVRETEEKTTKRRMWTVNK